MIWDFARWKALLLAFFHHATQHGIGFGQGEGFFFVAGRDRSCPVLPEVSVDLALASASLSAASLKPQRFQPGGVHVNRLSLVLRPVALAPSSAAFCCSELRFGPGPSLV